MMTTTPTINILVCALGGEGGGVLAEWLVDTARACGHSVQSTSIPGVAQRTGATTYYVEIHPQPDAALGARRPVFGLSPVPGELDLIVSSELLETVRQIGNGMARAARTHVISSRSRALTTAEKMQLGDGRASTETLMQIVRAHSREAQLLDMSALAQRHGTVMSAVLFGAIAASGALPFEREAYRRTIREAGTGVEPSLRGFDAAFEAVIGLRADRAAVQQAMDAVAAAQSRLPGASPLPTELRDFPPSTHELVALGHARVLEYQDAAYASLYVERLRRVLTAEHAGDPTASNDHATTRETARHLALWMAYDDIVRVAELKCRASRYARVRGEVKAGDGDLVRLYDHFKPGVPEFAALLPRALAGALTRWDRRRVARGKAPFALALKVPTHTVSGWALLRSLAALKPLRLRGTRHAAEQSMIERWLVAVDRGAREHPALGRELADCGRLIKGYGATNDRGKENLLQVIDHLARDAPFDDAPQRAAAIAAARNAALADDAGKALDQTLTRYGAPPRAVKEQPVRWVRQRPGALRRDAG